MVKLIRLASNNDGLFKSAFGSSIDIKPNGKIALLNLTFRTDFNVLNINDSNSEITFWPDYPDAGIANSINLPYKTYTMSNITELMDAIEKGLNDTLVLDPTVFIIASNNISSSFQIRLLDDLVNIRYRYAPFVNPFNDKTDQEPNPSVLLMKFNPNSLTVLPNANSETEIKQITGEPSTLLRNHNGLLTNQYVFSKGNGMYYARIADWVDNGSGFEDNGAGIGLTNEEFFKTISPGQNIPLDMCTFEVRFNRLTETYKYIVNGDSVERDSGILPTVVSIATSGSRALHDVMFIEKSGPYIQVGVYQNVAGTATRQVFGTGTDLAGTIPYWSYLFVRGASTDIMLDMVNISIEPFNEYDNSEEPPFDWDILGASDDSALENGYGDLTASVNPSPGSVMPELLEDRWDDIPDKICEIDMNSSIWKALGFKNNNQGSRLIGQNTGTIGWTGVWRANGVSDIVGSDNFVVVSDTLPLDSYDASKVFYTEQDNIAGNVSYNPDTERLGRRQNILMTIPENNNQDGLVEFQTNTPIFIDINNVGPMNVRNLQFRILNKDFSKIQTHEESSIMTILIED